MNIIILGGTGFIGSPLSHSLVEEGHCVTVLSRNPQQSSTRLEPSVEVKKWDPLQWGTLEKELEGKDAIINLAGEPIAEGRWTELRKKDLRDSRIHVTHLVVNALSNLRKAPGILINASGIGYYGPTSMTPVDEHTTAGTGFLAELCVDWEKEAAKAQLFGTRVVSLRIGMVLGKDGGALKKMLLPFKLFMGGPILPGTQPVSWIHRTDLVNLIRFILTNENISGPVNAVAPHASTMTEFCQALGRALHRPSWIPDKFGFTYEYPTLDSALEEIVEK
jgi:uncharacterized protein (TIGR01777 family)